jgi:hypothetical protein
MRIFSALAFMAALCTPAAFAQSASAAASMPACDGTVAVIRVSDIKAESMDKFLAAVAAQKDWYASHGLPDKIFVTKIIDRDASAYSTTQAITYHFYGNGNANPKHDAAWDAFVKMFSESSTIKAGYLSCVPKEMAPK